MRFFGETMQAGFVNRPNRFVVTCRLGGTTVRAYLPNPGRLNELLLPGATLFLEKAGGAGRKLGYTAVAVMRDGAPIMLHTHVNNLVAGHLLEQGLVPGLKGARIVRREVPWNNSRFDFLLKQGKREIFLEVKSCTLFGREMAMFPDAVTERGRRHLRELAELKSEHRRGSVLFVVHNPGVTHFLPEYHTDLAFARSFLEVRNRVKFIPLAVGWDKNLDLNPDAKKLEIPWKALEREAKDRGSYILILELKRGAKVNVGRLGRLSLEKGFYTYVGSAKKALSKRVARHKGLRKANHWHIDYLRERASVVSALPVLTADDVECPIARTLAKIYGGEVKGFGSSDCVCPSHLIYSAENPLESHEFHEMLQYYRMDRLIQKTL